MVLEAKAISRAHRRKLEAAEFVDPAHGSDRKVLPVALQDPRQRHLLGSFRQQHNVLEHRLSLH